MPRKTSAVLAVAPADQAVAAPSLKDQMKSAKAELKALEASAKAVAKQIASTTKAIAKLDAQMLKAKPAPKSAKT